MPAWLFGTAIALLVGGAASLYLWLIRRRDDETAAGLIALAGMRWRDFSRLVLETMELRGLYPSPVSIAEARNQGSTFLLNSQSGEQRWLLSCKHGIAYRIGSATVEELAAEVRMRGAQRGILVTEGKLDRSGLDKAERHQIEVLDATRLWPEVKPLIEGGLQRRIVDNAKQRALRHIVIAWLGAITLGLGSSLVLDQGIASNAPSATATAPVATPAANPKSAATPAPSAAAIPAENAPRAPASEAELEQQRGAVSRALLGRGRGISRGVWISRSTLSVDRLGSESEALGLVCAELARYPDLSLTRVQLNPPPGSDEAVRWRQCKASAAGG